MRVIRLDMPGFGGTETEAPQLSARLAEQRTEIVDAPRRAEPTAYEYRKPHRLLTVLVMLVAFAAAGLGAWYLLGR